MLSALLINNTLEFNQNLNSDHSSVAYHHLNCDAFLTFFFVSELRLSKSSNNFQAVNDLTLQTYKQKYRVNFSR